MTQFSDAFSQGTQVGQQRAALGLQALSLAGQMERQQAEAQMQAERQRAAMAALDERVKQKRVDGELLGHVMNRNFGAITPNLLMDASEEMRNVALRDNDLRELRSKWKPMYDQYMASGTLDRATPEALQAFRRFRLPIVGVKDVDDRIKDLHAQAGAGAFNDLAARLGAQGVQLGREESALMDRYIGMFAGQEDETFQAGLTDILQQAEAMAMQRRQLQDREALARGEMSQVDFLARYGTNAQVANAVQERDAAKANLAQVTNDQNTLAQLLESAGVPTENAKRIASLSAGARGTAIDVLNRNEEAANQASVAASKDIEQEFADALGQFDTDIEDLKLKKSFLEQPNDKADTAAKEEYAKQRNILSQALNAQLQRRRNAKAALANLNSLAKKTTFNTDAEKEQALQQAASDLSFVLRRQVSHEEAFERMNKLAQKQSTIQSK